jgi:uncharacterized membrane protein
MPEEARRRDQLLGLFALGLVLFNPPLLYLFSGGTILGWPLLYAYIFVVWGLVIAIVAIVVSRRRRRTDQFETED